MKTSLKILLSLMLAAALSLSVAQAQRIYYPCDGGAVVGPQPPIKKCGAVLGPFQPVCCYRDV